MGLGFRGFRVYKGFRVQGLLLRAKGLLRGPAAIRGTLLGS